MKEIIIEKSIESEVEGMIALASQLATVKKSYPDCWALLSKQFLLKDYIESNFYPDDIENVKVGLYAAIVRHMNASEAKKKDDIKKAVAKK